jgi:hypothetical protein
VAIVNFLSWYLVESGGIGHFELLLLGGIENRYEAPMSFFFDEGDPSLVPLHPHYGEILVAPFRRPRVEESARGIVSNYSWLTKEKAPIGASGWFVPDAEAGRPIWSSPGHER